MSKTIIYGTISVTAIAGILGLMYLITMMTGEVSFIVSPNNT